MGYLLNNQKQRFFKKNFFYFIVRSDNKTSYFFLEDLPLVSHWVAEIQEAKEFYEWFTRLT